MDVVAGGVVMCDDAAAWEGNVCAALERPCLPPRTAQAGVVPSNALDRGGARVY